MELGKLFVFFFGVLFGIVAAFAWGFFTLPKSGTGVS